MSHRALHDMRKAPFLMVDPGDAGTICMDRWGGVVPVVTAAAETRTLAQPTKAGQQCTIVIDTYVGAMTLTVTGGYNQAAATAIIFGTAGDWATFVSVKVGSSYYWRIVAQEGTNATLTGGHTVTGMTVTTGTVTTLTATALKLAVTAVNAAGNVIGNAAALSIGLNVVAGADNTKGVKLPVAQVGLVVAVKSSVNSKTLLVYPQVSSAIDAVAANGAVTLGAAALGAGGLFIASTTTQWRHFPIDVT